MSDSLERQKFSGATDDIGTDGLRDGTGRADDKGGDVGMLGTVAHERERVR